MTESGPVTLERRAHPRVEHRAQAEVVAEGETTPIPCETVDISLGGVKITSVLPIPVGACEIRLDDVAFPGTVLGQVIDVDTGLVISRVRFGEVSDVAHDELLAITTASAAPIPTAPVAALPTRRFYAGIAAAAVLVVAVVVVALIARGGSSSDDADTTSLASSASDDTEETASESPASDDAEAPATPSTTVPAPTASEEPATSDPAPAPAASGDPAPAPSGSDPAPTPAPAPVARTESADNGVRVELAEDSSQTVVASSVMPSSGVDTVRIQLDVIPEQQGTVLPVAVRIENRGERTLEMADGLTTTITVTAADGTTHDVVLRNADITELAPGERAELAGTVDFGSYGSFELTAVTPVAERA